ncbi:OVARIAN TUMOR DOMAIN-containing deubiquitinating enzyme 9-like [Lycium barbarum]|uniref:OVARIAN TUMOR DOMAIN-containing deubiquitinating enzyme 9-like n=1 Tax=Lycium barbarum TaxID=112863 RepID=UPI00293F3D7F|nr:OVARIAN TUMOR DOMAIN-containing deubiquitinating enzyme 9-like [Lycium barbarum]
MTVYEPDPDVVRWNLHLIDVCGINNGGSVGTITQYDRDFSQLGYVVMEGYSEPTHTNVENDEVIAHALQEELSSLSFEESIGSSHTHQEHRKASVLDGNQEDTNSNNNNITSVVSQVGSGKSSVHTDLIPILGGREFISYRSSAQGKAYQNSAEKEEDTDSNGMITFCPLAVTSSNWDHQEISPEIEDESLLDGEVGKRLNQLAAIPHVPKINGDIPSVDEAKSDHQRLMDRLEVYDLVELKVSGDGNCLFRSLSDQIYRSTEHHKFVREQVVKQLNSHRELYEGYVPMVYDEYLKKMSKAGEWGDHVTLQAAADSYGVKIFVITSFKDTCYIEIIPQCQKSNRTIFLSFWAEVHYNSIYPQGEYPAGETRKRKKWRWLG